MLPDLNVSQNKVCVGNLKMLKLADNIFSKIVSALPSSSAQAPMKLK